jgi:hypothetical protein
LAILRVFFVTLRTSFSTASLSKKIVTWSTEDARTRLCHGAVHRVQGLSVLVPPAPRNHSITLSTASLVARTSKRSICP